MRTWILRRFRAYGQRSLLLAIVLTPLVFHRGTLDVFNLFKLWVLTVLGVLAVFAWFAWSLERGIWVPRFIMGWAAAAFLSTFALATILSEGPRLSLFGRYGRYGGLAPTALYVLLMVVLVGLFWEHPGSLNSVTKAVAGASALVAAYAVIQATGHDPTEWLVGGAPPAFSLSTLGNPNFVGGYLGICLPLVLHLVVSSKRPWASLFGGILALDLVGLWVAGSRGGMVGAAAGLAAVAFFRRDALKKWMRWAIAVALAAAAILAVLVIWHPGMSEPPAALADLQILRRSSLFQRQRFWEAGWKNFLDHPLVGTGPDTFYSVYGRYRADTGVALADKPHNILIEYASNTGILGLGSYLVLAGLGLWYAGRAAGRADHPQRALLAAFASSFVAYLSQGFFSIDVPPLAIMGWIGLGGIAVLADPKILEARTAREEILLAKLAGSRKKKNSNKTNHDELELVSAKSGGRASGRIRAVQAAGAGIVLAVLALGSRALVADVKARTAKVWAIEAKSPSRAGVALGRARAEISAAIRLNPLEASYQRSAAEYLLQQAADPRRSAERDALFEQAARRLLKAEQLEPGNVYGAMSLGRLYARWAKIGHPARFETANVWWSRAMRRDPRNWQVNYHFGAFLNEWGIVAGRPEVVRRSLGYLEKSTRIKPELPHLWKALGQSYLAVADRPNAQKALGRALALRPGDRATLALMAKATAG